MAMLTVAGRCAQASYEAHAAARQAVAAAEARLSMLPGVVSLPLWVHKRKGRGVSTAQAASGRAESNGAHA
jgi:hypothetical protein